MRAVVAVLLFVTALHDGLWGALRDRQQAPEFTGLLPSTSYAPFEPGHTVDAAADADKVRADMKKLSTLTRAVRLYSSTEGAELVPPIAAEFGLKVTVGIWIDKDSNRNNREIEAAINLSRHNSNVIGIVVGTYSSIFFATPLLVTLRERTELVRAHSRRVGRRRSPGSRDSDETAASDEKAEPADAPSDDELTDATQDDVQAVAASDKPVPNKPAPGARPVRPTGTRRPTGKRNVGRR